MAYGTDSGLTSYATARGITLSETPSVLLTLAHDYIESLEFIGLKTDENQANQWPRVQAFVDGYELDFDEIPKGIIDAEYQVAIAIDQGNSPLANISPGVKREKVDVLEIEYQDGAGTRTVDPKIAALLRKYLAGGGGMANVRVSRA